MSRVPSIRISSISVCPNCGVHAQSGEPNCCARGGSWFGKCGDPSAKFEHTWTDGMASCKGKALALSPCRPTASTLKRSIECLCKWCPWFDVAHLPTFVSVAPAAISRVETTTVVPTPSCPKCGVNKKSGKGNCCARGGSWFQKCGDEGDTNFEHTWSEGMVACSHGQDLKLDRRFFEGKANAFAHAMHVQCNQ